MVLQDKNLLRLVSMKDSWSEDERFKRRVAARLKQLWLLQQLENSTVPKNPVLERRVVANVG